MENEEYGIKLRLLTSGFKTALKRTARETKIYGEEMEKSTTISPKAGVAILGVVGALALLAKATNKYIQSDKQLQGEMKIMGQVIGNMVSALGNALSPAIKGVINVAEYAIIVLAKLIQLFTGFNALENINNDNLDKTTKKAKAASKALAGFDTLTTLSSSSGGSGANDIGISTDAMKAFQEKVAEVDKIFEDYGTHIKVATGLLLGFVGVSMLGKIAKFIGVAGVGGAAGTGLAGIAGLLGWIAALGVLAIEISLIIKGIEKWEQFKQDMVEHGEWVEDNNQVINDGINKNVDSYKKLAKQEKKTKEEEKQLIAVRKSILSQTNNLQYSYKDEVNLLEDLIKSTGPWSEATKKQVTVMESLTDRSKNQVDALLELANTQNLSKSELEAYAKEIETQISLAENAAKTVKLMGGNYEATTKNIDSMKNSLATIKSKYTTTIDINANTKDLETKTNNWFKTFTSGIANWLNTNMFGTALSTAFNVGKKVFGSVLKFDVGTNYVPQDTLAMVHKGEMIVPKKYNPSTSGMGVGNEEVVSLLRELNTTLENKEFNGYISARDITDTAINGINEQSRIMGRSVLR